jgi:hypothetical protein
MVALFFIGKSSFYRSEKVVNSVQDMRHAIIRKEGNINKAIKHIPSGRRIAYPAWA